MPTPIKPATNIQWNAIQNGANNNSLVSQLYAAKPVTQTAPIVAASSAVKNQNAPNPFNTPATNIETNATNAIGGTLDANTPSPSSSNLFGGLFSTTPPAPTPSPLPASGTTMNLGSSAPTVPQTAAVVPANSGTNTAYVNPNAQSQQINTGTAGTPVQPPNPPTVSVPLTQTGQTAATLANTAVQGSQTGQTITNNLAQTSAASSPAATTAEQATMQAGQGNQAIGAEAANIGNNYGGQINTLQQSMNEQEAANASSGAPVGLGRAGLIAQYGGQELQGLSAAEQAALAGTSQQLTAQQQEANAAAAAGGLANTQQANIQSGEAAAGGLANTAQSNVQSGLQASGALTAPSGTFPFVFNPATGSYSVSGGNLQGAISGGVQQAVSNPALYSALNDAITSTYGSAAAGMFQQAYIAAGGNPTTATAQGSAAATNTETAGTTPTTTAAAGYSTSLQNYSNANAAYTTAQNQAQNVQNILASTGINASNSQDWNSAINSLSARLGSANQAQYIAGLNELQATYTSLLSSVGAATPTVNGQQATAIFNPSSTPAQIDAAIQALNQAAYAKLSPLYTQVQQYQASLNQGGGSSGTSTGSSANTITVGQYSFSKNAQGQWVAN